MTDNSPTPQAIEPCSACGALPCDQVNRPTIKTGRLALALSHARDFVVLETGSTDPEASEAATICLALIDEALAAMPSSPAQAIEPSEALQARRKALVERLLTTADLCCDNPLPGELGDVAYDLLRQAAAQIASDQLRFERSAAMPSSPGEVEALQEAIGSKSDWTEKLAELYQWTGSQEVEDKPELYSFLCSLIGYLIAGKDMASQSPPITEAREASKSGHTLERHGYAYLNEDTGREWSPDHPVESGEVHDATEIEEMTLNEFNAKFPVTEAREAQGVAEVYVCSNPRCDAAYTRNPAPLVGHCPNCHKPSGGGYSCVIRVVRDELLP